jgi:hypothetical protein
LPKPRVAPPKKPRIRSASRFKRSETSRIIKGVVDAGFTPSGIEADHASGTIRVLFGKPDEPEQNNALDDWQRKKDAGRS